jgi:hypothetical protein
MVKSAPVNDPLCAGFIVLFPFFLFQHQQHDKKSEI